MFPCMRSKDQVRRAVWRAMEREGVSRFPGAEGRIPNFAGAKIDAHTCIATTTHPIQILREHLMMTDHDLPVDLVATPRAVIEVERVYDRPRGILWDHLQPPQIHEIPILERMGYAG